MTITPKQVFSKRILPMLLAVLMLLTTFMSLASSVYADASSTSITVTYSHGKAYIKGVSNSRFTAKGNDGSTGIAYCMDKGQKYTSSNKIFKSPKKCPDDLNFIMNMGYPNNSASKLADLANVSSLTKDQARAATQMALWSCGYGNDININSRSAGSVSGSAKVLKAAKWLYNNRNDDQTGFMTFYYYSNGTSGHQRFLYSEGDETNTLTFMKISKAPDVTEKNTYYGDLTDARFKLYEGSNTNGTVLDTLKVKKGTLADVFDVDEDMKLDDVNVDNTTEKLLERAGITSMSDTIYYTDIEDEDLKGKNEFEAGQKYTIAETTVPEGFKKSASKTFTLDSGNNIQIIANDPIYGQIKLNKKSGNTAISDGNNCYSLAGAVYEVKGANSFNADVKRTITTNASGYAETTKDLPLGQYTVSESKVSPGYAIDKKVYPVTLSAKDAVDDLVTKIVTSVEIPKNDPVDIMLGKIDSELEKNVTQGAATFAGAEYTVRYFDGQYSTVAQAEASGKAMRTWIFKTDEDGYVNIQDPDYFVSGDKIYYNTFGDVCFPLGTLLIQETKTPEGYLIDKTVHLRNITNDGGDIETVETYVSPTSIEQVKRGDLELIKISDTTHKRLANVPFEITSLTTGESHIIVTDDNGFASTHSEWNPHTQNTNAGQTSEDGVWFSKNHDGNGTYFNESSPDNDKGALIYDTYSITELKCESNKGKELIPSFNVRIYKDSHLVKLGTMTNDDESTVEIGTTAKDGVSGTDNVVKDTEAVIIDTVAYKNLTVGKTYTLIGTLMNKSTEEPILVNGQKVTSEVTFSAITTNGSVDVTFTFDASSLKMGDKVVVFENMYLDSLEVASHADINDKGQTITITEPIISTKATDKETGGKEVVAGKEVTIVDTVSYENLVIGKTYVMKGKLMDKSTNKPLIIDGKEVTAEKEFISKTKNGSVTLEFTFDATDLIGKDIVVFEDAYRNDTLIAQHADINDEGQTIKIVEKPTLKEPNKDDEPGSGSPKTGDDALLLGLAAIAVIAALAVLIILSRKKKWFGKDAKNMVDDITEE